MHTVTSRWAVLVTLSAAAALTACAPHSRPAPYYAGGYYSDSRPVYSTAPVGVEFGRIANIEAFQVQGRGQTSGGGAILGAVVGGLLGHQVGKGMGRDAATAVGVLGGAVAGNAIEAQNNAREVRQVFRLTVHLDQGGHRIYDVPHPGDLRMGDRVRLYNGQISRI